MWLHCDLLSPTVAEEAILKPGRCPYWRDPSDCCPSPPEHRNVAPAHLHAAPSTAGFHRPSASRMRARPCIRGRYAMPLATAHTSCEAPIPALRLLGRYLKYSRTLSQTPWVIDGERRTATSVQELIERPILNLVKPRGMCPRGRVPWSISARILMPMGVPLQNVASRRPGARTLMSACWAPADPSCWRYASAHQLELELPHARLLPVWLTSHGINHVIACPAHQPADSRNHDCGTGMCPACHQHARRQGD